MPSIGGKHSRQECRRKGVHKNQGKADRGAGGRVGTKEKNEEKQEDNRKGRWGKCFQAIGQIANIA